MSRGPGALQQRILAELRGANGFLLWSELKQRFPRQANDHSLFRAVRSLKRMNHVCEFQLRGRRWIAATTTDFENEADRELLRLANAVHYQLRTIAAARGVKLPAIESPAQTVDAYKRTGKVSE